MPKRVLILGGTAESRQLADRLAARHCGRGFLLSFAGRTRSLRRPVHAHRVGGFGGVDGLMNYLRQGHFEGVLDATHPFAAQMSAHAVRATTLLAMPLLRLDRPPWQPARGDRWEYANSMSWAARMLGRRSRRVFLAIGKQEVGVFAAHPEHFYLWRTVDPELPPAGLLDAVHVAARGPFGVADEVDLLRKHGIDVVVCKNAGSHATYAKLIAARQLGIRVVMVNRPLLPAASTVTRIDDAVAWIEGLLQKVR